jgi:hypothetical protein
MAMTGSPLQSIECITTVSQPAFPVSRFECAVNARAAKTLDFKSPQSRLLRADEVIE